jgi:Protein of unknown function (DUF3618)
MAQRSDELKGEIERTRERIGETADALAYKADVPARTKDWVGEKKEAVVGAFGGATSAVTGATPDGTRVADGMGRLKRLAERNPLGLAIGGAAAGFLAGMLAPSTRMENERIGLVADEVKETAVEAGREALDRGKQVVQKAGESAFETVKERGRAEGEDMSAILQEKAREVLPGENEGSSAGGSAPSLSPSAPSQSPSARTPHP